MLLYSSSMEKESSFWRSSHSFKIVLTSDKAQLGWHSCALNCQNNLKRVGRPFQNTFLPCGRTRSICRSCYTCKTEWSSCAQVYTSSTKGGRSPMECDASGNPVDKFCFRMMVWLCAYYDFYDKKVQQYQSVEYQPFVSTIMFLSTGDLSATVQSNGEWACPLPPR